MTFQRQYGNPVRMSKPITKPIPVRIPKDVLNRIEAAAKKLGSNRSRIVSFAAQKFTEHAENQSVVTMPPNWREIFKSLEKVKHANPPSPAGKAKSAKARKPARG